MTLKLFIKRIIKLTGHSGSQLGCEDVIKIAPNLGDDSIFLSLDKGEETRLTSVPMQTDQKAVGNWHTG